MPATVTVIESLGHERNIVCRLDDGTFVITRQDMDAAAAGRGRDGASDGRTRAPARVRRRTGDPDGRGMTRRRGGGNPSAAGAGFAGAPRHVARLRAGPAVAVRVRHLRLLPVHQELLARPVQHAAVPGLAATLGRRVAVPRRADLAPVHEQLQGDDRVRLAHRARSASRSDSDSQSSRISGCAASGSSARSSRRL